MIFVDQRTMDYRRRIYSVLILVLLLGFTVAAQVDAQEAVTDDQVNEIAREVYCPVCENTPLDVCETQACADWRELIRTKLGQGESREEIFDYFARQYGDRVLASPPKEGFSLIVWMLPVAAILVGAVAFTRYMRNLRISSEEVKSATDAPAAFDSDPVASDDYMARIERELAEK